ncbi:MAG: hypothetical protein LBE38_06715 [Deltaproteobacteria bacterium]|jgi:hypothetical protein|nr:hypothetical protein [Deltaproteobacteria bacterium]
MDYGRDLFFQVKRKYELQGHQGVGYTRVNVNRKTSLNQEDEIKDKNTSKKDKKAMVLAEKMLLSKSNRKPCQVYKDQVIRLYAKKSYDDCPIDLRLVTIKDPIKQTKLKFVTKKFDLSPRTIDDNYRELWEVELFEKHQAIFDN